MEGPLTDHVEACGKVLVLGESDKLVFKVHHKMSDSQIAQMKKAIVDWAGRDVGILFLDEDIEFYIVKGIENSWTSTAGGPFCDRVFHSDEEKRCPQECHGTGGCRGAKKRIELGEGSITFSPDYTKEDIETIKTLKPLRNAINELIDEESDYGNRYRLVLEEV